MESEAWRVERGAWSVEGSHPEGISSRFTLHASRSPPSGRMGGDFKKNGFCGELGEKKCLPLPMNRVIFFQYHG